MRRNLPWLGFLAVLVVVLLAGLAGPTVATHGKFVGWLVVIPKSAPVGTAFSMNVSGPSGGTFAVNITSQPFNTSPSLFYATFHLPVDNVTNESTLNVSVPAQNFLLGGYQVEVLNGSFVAWVGVIRLVNPLNATQILTNITNIEQTQAAQQNLIAQLSAEVQAENYQVSAYQWFTIGAILLVGFYVPIRERALRVPGYSRRLAEMIHRWNWNPTGWSKGTGDFREEHTWTHDPPGPRYRCSYCGEPTKYFTLNEVKLHLRKRHSVSVPSPKRDYFEVARKSKEAVRPSPTLDSKIALGEARRDFKWTED